MEYLVIEFSVQSIKFARRFFVWTQNWVNNSTNSALDGFETHILFFVKLIEVYFILLIAKFRFLVIFVEKKVEQLKISINCTYRLDARVNLKLKIKVWNRASI